MLKRSVAGSLVYDLNFTVMAGTSEWNVDVVLGAPPSGSPPAEPGSRIRRSKPATVQIAIEIKSVMTEHRKAVKNRKRDFEAHHDHVHRYSGRAIAGGVLVVNTSKTFQSPLRQDLTTHANPSKLAAHCIEQMRAVSVRASTETAGLDAKAVLVVDVDNVNLSLAKYASGTFVPPVGDPMQYDGFIQRVCALFTERFAS
jgi:hypothetical protein